MTAPASAQPSRKRILVVDDNANLLVLLGHALRSAGYEVDEARDGAEGLQKFHEGTWDAVVTDHAMPELNGEQLAAQIKGLAPQTPVILVTGFPARVKVRDLFDGIYAKPYTGASIRGALEVILNRPRREVEAEERA